MSAAERERPSVLGLCRRCNVKWHNVNEHRVIVSPRGFAHFGRNDGTTDCSRNATGPRWWWPL